MEAVAVIDVKALIAVIGLIIARHIIISAIVIVIASGKML